MIAALVSGVLCTSLYKLYIYINNRDQFEDSNLFVSAALVLIVTLLIYLAVSLITVLASSKAYNKTK
jgi:hypothetical protein